MIEWFQSLTFFNWLSLLAFIFACISVSNALLSLRSRFKDWWGTRTKKSYEKRLRELMRLSDDIGRFKKDPFSFIYLVINRTMTALSAYAVAALLLLLVSVPPGLSLVTGNRALILVLIATLIISFATVLLISLIRWSGYLSSPRRLKDEVLSYLREGDIRKLLTPELARTTLDCLHENGFISDKQKEMHIVGLGVQPRLPSTPQPQI